MEEEKKILIMLEQIIKTLKNDKQIVSAKYCQKAYDYINRQLDLRVIPHKICAGENTIKIIETELERGLGRLKLNETPVIEIEKNQPPIGKIITFIHELIHYSDEECKEQKLYKRGLGEQQVENLAGTLTLILLQNGLLNLGIYTKKEINAFLESCG